MGIMSDVVDFAIESGAASLSAPGGLRLSWDMGRTFLHLWIEGGQYRGGTSERAEERVPTMLTPDEALMARWAILEVGDRARAALRLTPIVIPDRAEDVNPAWGFEQLSLLTGRLVLGGAPVPMELRTIFPAHRALNRFAQVIGLNAVELLDSYRAPDGQPLLANFLTEPPAQTQ